ncbi:MAG: sulfatase [Thermoanaerobaculia bacterium]
MTTLPRRRLVLPLLLLLFGFGLLCLFGQACAPPDDEPAAIRLVDRFADAAVEGSLPRGEPPPKAEWSFGGGQAMGGTWAAGPRTAGLRLTEEGLSGRSTGPYPALVLERPAVAGEGDRLHEIVVRLRSSKGSTLSLTTLGEDGPPPEALAGETRDLTLHAPLVAGPDFQTYNILLDRSFGLGPLSRGAVKGVVLRPSDEEGAEFTLESVRLVFRKERLAAIPTGIGWHGLADVWRDTVVSRAGESVTWSVDLPSRPWLDLALGTISEGAVAFDVQVATPGEASRLIHQETLTTPERWRERRIDLAQWAGRTVDLSFTAHGSDSPNGSAGSALAFWGSPVVRNRLLVDRENLAPRPGGVIVVLADTLRKHHLSAYGHHRANTPHLSRLAEQGVLFDDAISQATWTKVSVPSILSSLYPSTHGIVSFNDRLSSAAVTLAEALQSAGYATWATSSVAFAGQLTNLQQGVEVLYERGAIDLPEGVSSSKTGRSFVDELEPWLERHRDVPFFAMVHAMDPHSPFRPYAPYDTLWTDEEDGRRYLEDLEKIRPHIKSPLLRRFGMPSREEMEAAGVQIGPYVDHERAWYDASILALDAELGRLQQTLGRLGRDRDTIIAFVSDHGEEFLEHGSHWHGLSVYAEMIEVPLILHWPAGLPAGRVVESTVQTIDLMPTLLELTGLPIPDRAQGKSLVALFSETGDTGRRPPAFVERTVEIRPGQMDDALLRSDSVALVEGEWKLIWNTRQAPGVPEYELFHRPSDPMDQANVAGEEPEVVTRLAATLERWREGAVAARLPSSEEAAKGLSADELERLRSLGYL